MRKGAALKELINMKRARRKTSNENGEKRVRGKIKTTTENEPVWNQEMNK